MKIWKAGAQDHSLVLELCRLSGCPVGRELTVGSVEKCLTQPGNSLVGLYLVAAEEKPLMGIWVKPLRKTVAIHRIVSTLAEENEDFAHYLQQFLAMLTYHFRSCGMRSLFMYTQSDYVQKVAFAAGFEPCSELIIYWKRDRQLPPAECNLPVIIRPLVDEDLAGLVAVEESVFMPEVWNDRDTFREMANAPQGKLFVAVILEQIVGYIYVLVQAEGSGQISRVGVHRDYQQFGLGKMLLTTGLSWLQEKGAGEVMLHVRRENMLARMLYERYGFAEESLEYLLLYSEGGCSQ